MAPDPRGRISTGLSWGCFTNVVITIVLGTMSPSYSLWDLLIVFVFGPTAVTAVLSIIQYRKGESETVKGYAIALAITVLLSSPCWWTGA